jgi:hypothetical protein
LAVLFAALLSTLNRYLELQVTDLGAWVALIVAIGAAGVAMILINLRRKQQEVAA